MDPIIVPVLTALIGVVVRAIAVAELLGRLRWQERQRHADRSSGTAKVSPEPAMRPWVGGLPWLYPHGLRHVVRSEIRGVCIRAGHDLPYGRYRRKAPPGQYRRCSRATAGPGRPGHEGTS